MSANMLDIPSDYDSLLVHYNALRLELDLANQSVHNQKTTLKIKEALEQDLNDEIYHLKRNSKAENYLKTIQQQQEELSYLKKINQDNEDRLWNQEQELEKRDREITDLKSQLESIQKSSKNDSLIDDNHIQEMEKLKFAVEELENRLQDITEMHEEESNMLKNSYKEVAEELATTTEILNLKKEELQEANALIQTQKDDLLVMKAELDTLKSEPLSEGSRGNSLFAEVNDRRIKLEETMKKMKAKYMEMKTKYDSKSTEAKTLREQILKLIERLQYDTLKHHEEDMEEIKQCYEDKLVVLNSLIDSYKKELTEKYKLHCMETSVVDNLMFRKNKELEELRENLRTRTLTNTMLSQDLAVSRREEKRHHLECIKLKNELLDLNQDKVKLVQLESEAKELKEEIEKLKNTKDYLPRPILKSGHLEESIVNENKENCDENKKVQFSIDTMDTDKVTIRRRRQVVLTTPVHYE